MTARQLIRLTALAALTMTLSACSILGNKQKERLAYIERPAEVIYNQGVDRMDRADWDRAKLYFQEVERQHPFSKWARRSMLMASYANYRSADYEEAISTSR